MKLALDSILSKYTQGMHSNSTVIYLPDNIYVCRNCVVADGLDIIWIPPPPEGGIWKIKKRGGSMVQRQHFLKEGGADTFPI